MWSGSLGDGVSQVQSNQQDRRSGSFSLEDGSAYCGDYIGENVMDGEGTMEWQCGDVYKGQWSQGHYHGHGTLSRKEDGSVVEGRFHQGEVRGFFSLKTKSGDIFFQTVDHGNVLESIAMVKGDGSPVPAVSESLSACAVVYSVSAQYPMLSKQRGKTLEELLTRKIFSIRSLLEQWESIKNTVFSSPFFREMSVSLLMATLPRKVRREFPAIFPSDEPPVAASQASSSSAANPPSGKTTQKSAKRSERYLDRFILTSSSRSTASSSSSSSASSSPCNRG